MAGDMLLLEGEPAALERVVALGRLKFAAAKRKAAAAAAVDAENFGVMEAVVTSEFPLVDKTIAQAGLAERHEIGLLAVSRRGERLARRLRTIKFQTGDVIVLQGDLTRMPEALGELRCLLLPSVTSGLDADAGVMCRSRCSQSRWSCRFPDPADRLRVLLGGARADSRALAQPA